MENNLNTMMPRIGDQAPDFKALTTIGELTFSEYNKSSWVILFSHPADFTPVCTTEMSGFATQGDFWKEHQTKLLGLSIDSIHAHIAWVNAVKEKTKMWPNPKKKGNGNPAQYRPINATTEALKLAFHDFPIPRE